MRENGDNIILTDFHPVQLAASVPQDELNRQYALLLTKTQSLEKGIDSDEELNQFYQHIRSRVERYAISPDYITQRQVLVAEISLGDIPETLTLKDRYLRLEHDSELFGDVLKGDVDMRKLSLNDRMTIYEKATTCAIDEMYKEPESNAPDDIIHVTCSGYVSPSPIERLVSKNEWVKTTVTHSYHMGCYGAFPAIRMAHGFLSSSFDGLTPPKSKIDIVHTELLSMHSDLLSESAEDIIISTLFGDGFIKYSMRTSGEPKNKGFKLLTIKEHLLPGSSDDMIWKLGSHHFEMTLTLNVPFAIANTIKTFVEELVSQIGKNFEDVRDNMVFAVHPGGPKILDFIEEELGLTDAHVKFSDKIIQEHGNICSATIPFILNDILNAEDVPENTLVLCLAFGPGLTLAGMILEKI